jgi:ketosteroid isomerase-like protein
MTRTGDGPLALLERLLPAVNDHNLEALVSCFVDDYVNENPVHPRRDFRGKEQVRRNWGQIFGGVPNVHARVLRSATEGDTLWTEWEMWGTRQDGGAFEMRGVFIFSVEQGMARWARMFLEPVEHTSGEADAAVRQVVGDETIAAMHPGE